MLQPLLIEIGVEELPAVPLLKELKNIEKKWSAILEKNSLLCEYEFFYTPRRLVLWHREFSTSQADSVEEFYGAPIAIAYKDGEPTKAALGFAKKCGVDISEIARAEKGGKEVLYYKKDVQGQASSALIPAMIEEWMKSLSFGKSMRWGSNEESFIRPIRWVNVSLASKLIDMTLFNVGSSFVTYPHRMYSFDAIALNDPKEYFDAMKRGQVTLFQDERRETILKEFRAIERAEGIEIEMDEELLAEVVAITEHPMPLIGRFDEEFLRLPPEVIIASMKEHQRYFPVFKEGKLQNMFIVVSNALTDDYSKVIAGNEKVLRPRLADGLFFYDNDLRNGLKTDGLEKVVFMKGLGSLHDKIERESYIAQLLCGMYAKESSTTVERAVRLAKADLMSEMVYEFTELQGLMGYYYATQLGESDDVALAIKEQYLPLGEDSEVPSTVVSAIVALSIKLDTLFGLFSINQIPTGSRDPFALRRAVNGIIRIVNTHQLNFDITALFGVLSKRYEGVELEKLEAFFVERIRQYYKINPSIIESVLVTGERELLRIDAKLSALDTLSKSDAFSSIFSTFKRVANITKDIDMKGEFNVDVTLFDEEAEKELKTAFNAVIMQKFSDYESNLEALFALKPQLDKFFEDVMVNHEDEKIKNNRKSLVASIYKAFLDIADIKEIKI